MRHRPIRVMFILQENVETFQVPFGCFVVESQPWRSIQWVRDQLQMRISRILNCCTRKLPVSGKFIQNSRVDGGRVFEGTERLERGSASLQFAHMMNDCFRVIEASQTSSIMSCNFQTVLTITNFSTVSYIKTTF